VYFALYTKILEPHDDSGNVSSAAVSTAGTVCDASKHWTCSKGPVISSPVPKDNVSTGQKQDQRKDMQRRGSQRATQQVPDSPETGIQHCELSENECAFCFGVLEEDPEPVEWLKCTNEQCNVWSHTDCCDGAYVCYACGTLLISIPLHYTTQLRLYCACKYILKHNFVYKDC